MSDHKKDLTRIEDLGEFIHELNEDEESTSFEDDPSEVPDFPSENSESIFSTNEETTEIEDENNFLSSDFESSTQEDAPSWETNSEETTESPWDSPSEDLNENFTEPTWDAPETETLNETEQEPEPETEPAAEPVVDDWESPLDEPTPLPVYAAPEKEYKAPETFEDLKKFSESSSFTGMATEGNPSFSVLIKNVRYLEDVNDIIALLRELNLLSDSEEQTRGRLMRGMLLVPRISEYAAIFLAHKLRRFDIDIQLGLSDEIHPPKHQEEPETGIVSKFNLFQNQTHHFHFDDPKLEISQIILSATPSLEGYQIVRYMGVASEHKMLDNYIVEDSESTEVPLHYQELALKLKAHALKAHSNAVIGLNYQLTPIGHKYRLTCTGNLVWINKL